MKSEKDDPEASAPLREHIYDGIREYDHKLPNWWLYTLYAAIIYFVIDWGLYYKTSLFQTDEQKVITTLQEIEKQREEALAATLAELDDQTLITQWATNPQIVASGETIYKQVCIGCHASDLSATMLAGDKRIPLPGLPLNDGEWKYGGAPLDLFKIINDGTPADSPGYNGAKMQAWGQTFSPKQVAEVTAYLISKNPEDFKSDSL